ncbi:MAG: hypothetical protein J7L90_02050 [Dehalococcoidia bacterium]|nr:hypothetical protein [Dehalococcoidia bacterium]
MGKRIIGSVAIGALVCDACGKTMQYPERYVLVCDEADGEGERFCEDCSRKKGYLKPMKMDWGEEVESFL